MMLRKALDWLGFGGEGHGHSHGPCGHSHGEGGHGHTHGVVDPTIATTSRGIWAIKWSFIMLGATAVFQLVVVYFSGSVARSPTIHNVGDAGTAIPLWIAFMLVRRKPSLRFTHGMGRVEDLAGVVIVGIILFSAIVAGWQAIERFINPRDIEHLGWVAAAGVIGFLGNEAVAVFRINVGREIDSAALIADGYHARVDGLTSLAVARRRRGFASLADLIIGLVITIMILGIVWQSARRRSPACSTASSRSRRDRARRRPRRRHPRHRRVRALVCHRLAVELDIGVDGTASIVEADAIASALEKNSPPPTCLGTSQDLVRLIRKDSMTQSGEKYDHDHDHDHPHSTTTGDIRDHPYPHDDKDHKHDHPHPTVGGHTH
jgi:cation diffusion facilitator family transporter